MAQPFPQDVQGSLTPSGPILAFDAGPMQGQVYQDTSHIEVAGPNLAGTPKANRVHFAPPAKDRILSKSELIKLSPCDFLCKLIIEGDRRRSKGNP
jgi:hypothetical protein